MATLTSDLKRQMATGAALEAELNKERAAALGRTAAKLEALIERCAALRHEARAAGSNERERLAREYDETRRESETQRWNLCVQREAMGLYRHDDVDELYPRPAPRL